MQKLTDKRKEKANAPPCPTANAEGKGGKKEFLQLAIRRWGGKNLTPAADGKKGFLLFILLGKRAGKNEKKGKKLHLVAIQKKRPCLIPRGKKKEPHQEEIRHQKRKRPLLDLYLKPASTRNGRKKTRFFFRKSDHNKKGGGGGKGPRHPPRKSCLPL